MREISLANARSPNTASKDKVKLLKAPKKAQHDAQVH